MSEVDVLNISERLCERGLLRCTGIEDGMPRFELTLAGRLALLQSRQRGD